MVLSRMYTYYIIASIHLHVTILTLARVFFMYETTIQRSSYKKCQYVSAINGSLSFIVVKYSTAKIPDASTSVVSLGSTGMITTTGSRQSITNDQQEGGRTLPSDH